ncbi:MAG: SURF1 family protein [Gammaproteobacteria bacterium]|nr:SURF1 family protein [Gammaproteobacteria bacterium]
MFFVALFILLGVWQLHRFHYKKVLLNNYQARLHAEAIPFSAITNLDVQFKSVIVQGHFVKNSDMFIQNRLYKGRLGYDVITPFQVTNSKKLLLVDRGWVAESANHTVPDAALQKQVASIMGYLKLLDERQFILGNNISDSTAHSLIMQKIDIAELTKITHADYYPFVLRLAVFEPNGFTRDWTITAVEPERHMGYAIQWFVMAFVLMLAYLAFCCEKIK